MRWMWYTIYMQHIVFDLEWNQAVVKEKVIQSPFFLHGEIVQIGAVKLDDGFQPMGELKLDVRPAYYTRMNSRVRRLTGISNQQLKLGMPFPEALEQFQEWCSAEGPFDFITWGTDDMPILRENLRLYELDKEWLPTCYDLQRIYDAQVGHENRQWALATALEKLEITPIGQAHDALNDARNTVQVCAALDMLKGLAEYTEPARQAQAPRRGSLLEQEMVEEIFQAHNSRPFYCPLCGAALSAGEWVNRGIGKYLAAVTCEAHDQYLVKLHITCGADGQYTLTRSLRTMDEEGVSQLFKAPSKNRKRKRRRRKGKAAVSEAGEE